jgi:non-heme chloroperoxidase
MRRSWSATKDSNQSRCLVTLRRTGCCGSAYSGFPVLHNPANRKRAIGLTADQFHYGFSNTLTRAESDELYGHWIMPGPGQVPFKVGLANFTRHTPVEVDTRTGDRGPLLFIAGGRDHAAPKAVVKGAYRRYAGSSAVTDFHEFPDRGHPLVFDHGWREIAECTLSWLGRNVWPQLPPLQGSPR